MSYSNGLVSIEVPRIAAAELPTYVLSDFNIAYPSPSYAILNRDSTKVLRIWEFSVYQSAITDSVTLLKTLGIVRIESVNALNLLTTFDVMKMDENDPAFPAAIDRGGILGAINYTRLGEIKRFLESEATITVSTLNANTFAAEVFPRKASPLSSQVMEINFQLAKPLVLRTDGTTFQGMELRAFVVSGSGNIAGVWFLVTVSDT